MGYGHAAGSLVIMVHWGSVLVDFIGYPLPTNLCPHEHITTNESSYIDIHNQSATHKIKLLPIKQEIFYIGIYVLTFSLTTVQMHRYLSFY